MNVNNEKMTYNKSNLPNYEITLSVKKDGESIKEIKGVAFSGVLLTEYAEIETQSPVVSALVGKMSTAVIMEMLRVIVKQTSKNLLASGVNEVELADMCARGISQALDQLETDSIPR